MGMIGPRTEGTGALSEPAGVDSRGLHGLLNEALQGWLGLAAQYFSVREEGGADLSLELLLRFEDPQPGVLVLRSTPAFRDVLREAAERRSPGSTGNRELFTEAVVHFYQRFMWAVHERDCVSLKPARFKSSRPVDWPHREPDASCLSFVGRCPVEIRLWTGGLS